MKDYETYRLKCRKYNVARTWKEFERRRKWNRYIYSIFRRYLSWLVSSGTYLLFGDLKGFQIVANYAQFFFELNDLPAKWTEPFTTNPDFILDSYLKRCFFSVNEWLVIVRILLYNVDSFKIVWKIFYSFLDTNISKKMTEQRHT